MTDTTDKELLEDCLAAFRAITAASESRKLLKSWGITHEAYAGNRSHLLANYMATVIANHFGEKAKP